MMASKVKGIERMKKAELKQVIKKLQEDNIKELKEVNLKKGWVPLKDYEFLAERLQCCCTLQHDLKRELEEAKEDIETSEDNAVDLTQERDEYFGETEELKEEIEKLKEDLKNWADMLCEEFEVDSRVDICNLIYKLKEEIEKLKEENFQLTKQVGNAVGLLNPLFDENKELKEKFMAKDCEVSQLKTKVAELEYIILVAKKAKQPKM